MKTKENVTHLSSVLPKSPWTPLLRSWDIYMGQLTEVCAHQISWCSSPPLFPPTLFLSAALSLQVLCCHLVIQNFEFPHRLGREKGCLSLCIPMRRESLQHKGHHLQLREARSSCNMLVFQKKKKLFLWFLMTMIFVNLMEQKEHLACIPVLSFHFNFQLFKDRILYSPGWPQTN